jgi:hypothetical protein
LLVHGKILTAENLLKHGIQGPSRCPFFLSASESISHLFLECPFSSQVWNLIYLPLSLPPLILRTGMTFSSLGNKDMLAASKTRNNSLSFGDKSPNSSVGNLACS